MSIFLRYPQQSRKLFDQISRRTGKAIVDFGLINDKDKLIVGVSGGKDSMTLLSVMLHRREIAPVEFDIMAVHVDMGFQGPDLVKLEDHWRRLGVDYRILKADLSRGHKNRELNCFWCAWNRRKVLFEFAIAQGFNKIAFAHHMDDIVETSLMNQIFKGEFAAMSPRQQMFQGKITIIRPFAYESERQIAGFAHLAGLDIFETCRCAVAGTTQRAAVKNFLRGMEKVSPVVRKNVFNSLMNIQSEYLPRKIV